MLQRLVAITILLTVSDTAIPAIFLFILENINRQCQQFVHDCVNDQQSQ